MRLEITMRNRTAWNTAAMVGAAMAGKLPRYEEFFEQDSPDYGEPQTPAQQEAALRVLAAAWGAVHEE